MYTNVCSVCNYVIYFSYYNLSCVVSRLLLYGWVRVLSIIQLLILNEFNKLTVDYTTKHHELWLSSISYFYISCFIHTYVHAIYCLDIHIPRWYLCFRRC